MENLVSREVYEEFAKRMEDENHRQNRRIENLEKDTKQVVEIASSVRELALSIKQMAENQDKQAKRLEKLEEKDGEMWRKVVGYVITTTIGIILGFIFKQIGM